MLNSYEMDIEKALEILEQHQRWRRGDESVNMLEPRVIGLAIDEILAFVRENLEKRRQ